MAEILARNLARIDEWQTQELVKALRAGQIKLLTTRLKPADVADTGVTPVGSVEQAVLESTKAHRDVHVALVPEGPYVIPIYRKD
jgi:hypothetical protein